MASPDVLIHAVDAALEQREETFDGVRVNFAAHVFAAPVVDRLMIMFTGVVQFGAIEMEAHVLSDGKRVFTQREVVRALSGGRESGNLSRYLSRNPLTANDLVQGPDILFTIPPGTTALAIGSEATKLIEICDKYMVAEVALTMGGKEETFKGVYKKK